MAKPKGLPLPLLGKYSDMMLPIAAVLVVGMMVVPMPTWLLDVMLTLNIAMALTVLLVTIYATQPLEFSSFPSMLLLTTLFRLALNISATRLVLLSGSAGAVISAFGSVVVGGNYVVGIVVFIILVVIQFLVITSGTGRVAEVAARFTLDAMPGKQMAIDADLSAGIIDEREAQLRRKTISREADFYGAMDGSSKFVRGDAIAAVIMIIVNIIGGVLIGVLQGHKDPMDALQTYTLLTIGEGLVTQIPALLISTATGLMVTKAGSEKNIGTDMTNQMLGQPKALMICAAMCGALALIPGIPKLPFIITAAGIGYVGHLLSRKPARSKHADVDADGAAAAKKAKGPENMVELLTIDPIEIDLGYGLIALADPKQGGDLLERVTAVRRQAAIDMGILVPAIRVRDDMQLKPNTYVMKLRGLEVARGEVYPGHLLAMNPGSAMSRLSGIDTTEPAFGLPATWISDAQQMEAEISGYTIVDPLSVLITHITEVLRSHADEILTRQDAQDLIDSVKAQTPAVVSELIPDLLTLADVQKVLQNLLCERVSIRDLPLIMETLSDVARLTKDPDMLTEYARQALARQITSQYQSPDGTVRVFTLDPTLEQIIADNIRYAETGAQLVLDPMTARHVLTSTRTQIENMAAMGYQPVALCSPRTRVHFRRLVERMIPTLAVLSYNELASGAGLETIGMVALIDEAA